MSELRRGNRTPRPADAGDIPRREAVASAMSRLTEALRLQADDIRRLGSNAFLAGRAEDGQWARDRLQAVEKLLLQLTFLRAKWVDGGDTRDRRSTRTHAQTPAPPARAEKLSLRKRVGRRGRPRKLDRRSPIEWFRSFAADALEMGTQAGTCPHCRKRITLNLYGCGAEPDHLCGCGNDCEVLHLLSGDDRWGDPVVLVCSGCGASLDAIFETSVLNCAPCPECGGDIHVRHFRYDERDEDFVHSDRPRWYHCCPD